MKKIVSVIMLAASLGSFLFAETAEEIINKARTKSSVNSVATRSKMEIQKGGTTINILVIDQFSSKDAKGLQRTFIGFREPANVKGTRFLMLEKAGGAMDQRIFLPAAGKVRRIAAESAGNESFMGTDFSYNDVSFMERKTSLDTYTILRKEELDGKTCFVIEAVPKDKKYSYSKVIMWIEKENNILLKAEFYDSKDRIEKFMELSDYKDVAGILTPHTTKLSTVKVNTSTIIHIEKIQYGTKIPEKVFTQKYLETGK